MRLPPNLEKARDDMIAHLEFRDILPDGFHKPRPVRHRDTAIGYSIGCADNAIVMEVE